MQAVREDLRRVVRLANVNKITQLSPEALEAASNRALSALARHAPQAELAALDRWAATACPMRGTAVGMPRPVYVFGLPTTSSSGAHAHCQSYLANRCLRPKRLLPSRCPTILPPQRGCQAGHGAAGAGGKAAAAD